MDSSDPQSTTNASLTVEPSTLIGSLQLDYRPNTSIGTPNEQTKRLHLTHFFSQPSSPQRPYRYARSDRQFGAQPTQSYQQAQPTSSIDNYDNTLRQLQMLQDSQGAIQNQIDSLTQQTSTVGWYNSQLAIELSSGRPNLAVCTVATTPGLPWEHEMPADQAAHIRTILRAKNILPTPGATSSNQLYTVFHPPENLEIHPPDPLKSQISTF